MLLIMHGSTLGIVACFLVLYTVNGVGIKDFNEELDQNDQSDPNDPFPLPHYYKQYGIRGKNFDVDIERNEPYILCESFNRAECTATNKSDCVTLIKCFPERRSHQLGCMAVLVYNPNMVNESADMEKILQLDEPDLKGCWTQDESELRECSAHSECIVDTRHTGSKSTAFKFCCCRTHQCNHILTYIPEDMDSENGTLSKNAVDVQSLNHFWNTLTLLLVTGFSTIGIIAIICYLVYKYRQLCKPKDSDSGMPPGSIQLNTIPVREQLAYNVHCMVRVGDTIEDLRRTALLKTLSRGRFGIVYQGVIGGQNIAVKLCVKNEVDSWVNEQDIYAVRAMRTHQNICEFIASFEFGERHWLVTRFYQLGSLYDYLRNVESVALAESAKIIYGLLNGLAFLHEEHLDIGKPPMVHRDLKSKNVLLRENLTACISDFGLALKFDAGKTPDELTSQVGTRRYMAPEVLEGATEFTLFAFQQIDIYAAALVLWEVLDRTEVYWSAERGEDIGIAKLPYEDETGPMPALGVMRDIVVIRRERPKIKDRLRHDENANLLVGTMTEMWESEPDGRITSGCSRDRVARIIAQLFGPHLKNSAEIEDGVEPEIVALALAGENNPNLPTARDFAEIMNVPDSFNLQQAVDREEALEHAFESHERVSSEAEVETIANDTGDDAAALLEHVTLSR